MVGAGLERSWSRAGMDYGGANDLFWVWFHLAQPRADLAGSITAIKCGASLEGHEKCNRGENRNPLSKCKCIARVLDVQMMMTRQKRYRSQDVICREQLIFYLGTSGQGCSSPRWSERVRNQQDGGLFDVGFNFQCVT